MNYAIGRINANPIQWSELVAKMTTALAGDSNDAEHDVLVELYEFLTTGRVPEPREDNDGDWCDYESEAERNI